MRIRIRNGAALEERLKFYTKIGASNLCWPWSGPRTKRGYGIIAWRTVNGRQHIYAHRLSWILTCGQIPFGMQVLHRCDNPPCCNPQHLFLGTQADNMHDMKLKGRRMGVKSMPKGMQYYRTTLSDKNIKDIRQRATVGESLFSISRGFNLTAGAIWRITKRKNWKHIA